ncbi:arginine ABC transporter ATP-binding protein [Litchfieldella qijiaojingensis]|uniref:Arginine ABC transporter ATP-binding protein n=1 Tax=Litchfieldella qijiaojingensis TaxID=980347 RepID=A0ABQ2ZDD2_9GAMM|nr:amino acid ABC transporter ATP-binding protein [Halomonas qijiaojingensis]GGY09638.1 arginine ABC transporter ATP-binding protein [Halomonas qijiaojingensis]
MSDNPILRVRDVRKTYGGVEVLKGVSFDLERGQSKIVIGPSGTGKSTLLRCINLLSPPDSGSVILDGVTVEERGINQIRAQIGFVFQEFNLFTHLRVLDNVRLAQRNVLGRSKREATKRALEELERVGLSDKLEAYPAELSGGQKQRASIARALAMDPKLILFDEPTSALDPELTGEVVQVMKDLANAGMTMLVVSHEMGFAKAAADEVIFMEGGVIVEQGPPSTLFTCPEHARTSQFLRMITHEHEEG